MGLFVVLFWCTAALGAVRRFTSRFGIFNSRLGSIKFPLRRQREFPGKGLICRVVFGPEWHLFGTIAKIPGSTGITENSISRRYGWRRNLGRTTGVARASAEP